MPENSPPQQTPVELLTDDLQQMTRISNPVGFMDLQLPAINAEMSRTGLDTPELIAAAVSSITDDAVRRSAQQLFDLSSQTESFTHRSRLAAEQMGISFDGFRRRSGGRPSRRDLVVLELARQIQALPSLAADAGSAEASPADDHVEPKTSTPTSQLASGSSIADQSSNPLAIALLLVAAVALIVGGVVGTRNYIRSVQADRIAELARDVPGDLDMSLYCLERYNKDSVAEPRGSGWVCRDANDPANAVDIDPQEVCETQYGASTRALALDNSAGAWRCELTAAATESSECAIAPGAFDASLADTMSPFAQGFRQRFEQAESLPCPTNIMHRWADGVLQELGSADEESAIIALSPDKIVLLEGSAWAAFDRIKGITGSLVGYPLNEPVQQHGGLTVDLSADGALFGTGRESTFHWLPPVVYQYWIDYQDCLGPPVSDPYTNGDHFRQDFLNDSLVLNPRTVSFHALGDC